MIPSGPSGLACAAAPVAELFRDGRNAIGGPICPRSSGRCFAHQALLVHAVEERGHVGALHRLVGTEGHRAVRLGPTLGDLVRGEPQHRGPVRRRVDDVGEGRTGPCRLPGVLGEAVQERCHVAALHRLVGAEGLRAVRLVPAGRDALRGEPPDLAGVRGPLVHVGKRRALLGCGLEDGAAGQAVEEGRHVAAGYLGIGAEGVAAVAVFPALGNAARREPGDVLGVGRLFGDDVGELGRLRLRGPPRHVHEVPFAVALHQDGGVVQVFADVADRLELDRDHGVARGIERAVTTVAVRDVGEFPALGSSVRHHALHPMIGDGFEVAVVQGAGSPGMFGVQEERVYSVLTDS